MSYTPIPLCDVGGAIRLLVWAAIRRIFRCA